MGQVTIRDARPGDGSACARLWKEFGRALEARMPEIFREPALEGLEEWFEAGIAASGPDSLRALAVEGDRIVGLAHASISPPRGPSGTSLLRSGDQTRAVLEDIVVEQAARNRGVGTLLVRHVEAWARTRGAAGLRLTSDPDGPARRFYERLGFRIDAAMYVREL